MVNIIRPGINILQSEPGSCEVPTDLNVGSTPNVPAPPQFGGPMNSFADGQSSFPPLPWCPPLHVYTPASTSPTFGSRLTVPTVHAKDTSYRGRLGRASKRPRLEENETEPKRSQSQNNRKKFITGTVNSVSAGRKMRSPLADVFV